MREMRGSGTDAQFSTKKKVKRNPELGKYCTSLKFMVFQYNFTKNAKDKHIQILSPSWSSLKEIL